MFSHVWEISELSKKKVSYHFMSSLGLKVLIIKLIPPVSNPDSHDCYDDVGSQNQKDAGANTKPIGWRTRVYPLYLGGMDHEIPPVFGKNWFAGTHL